VGLVSEGEDGTSAASPERDQHLSERSKLVGRAGVVGAGTLASRILGLGRDVAFAALFTREQTDAFFVAFTLPNLLRQLLGEGAVSGALVPVLAEKLEKEGDRGAQAFFARARGLSLLALTIVTVLGMVFAGPLCELFAPGYHGEPGEFERTVGLTQVVFPYIFFMGTASLGMAALNAKRRFAVAAFAPGLLNVAFLAAAFTLPAALEASGRDRAYAMVYGALLGGVLQVVAQWPALRRIGFLGRPIFDLRDAGVRALLRRMVPIMGGTGIYYVDLMLSRRFLSELGPGAQSHFSWAMRICDFPQGIFVMALSTAALPMLSTLAAKGDLPGMARAYAHSVRLALFVAIPASVALVAIGEPLMVTLFQRGNFTAMDAHETARALAWQGGAIWTVALVRQTVPAFYAMGDTRTPAVVSGIDLCAFIGLAFWLRAPMGATGISVAVAGSSFVQMVLLLVLCKRKMGTLGWPEIGGSVARTISASAVAAGLSVVGVAELEGRLGDGPASRLVPGLAAGLVFVAGFALSAYALRSPELLGIVRGVRRKLRR
jgi:putative peptidoglycan lipid II flippase